MRGNVRGTKFSRFSQTAWSSAKVKSANYCGTRDNVVIIKWPTRRAVHVNVANYDYDRTKGAIGFILV